MDYATVNDVEVRLGRPPANLAESEQWGAWLTDVESIIDERVGGLDQAVTDGRITLGLIVMIEANAVVRRINNPDPTLISTTRTIDDASVTTRREGGATTDDAWLTAYEWGLLIPASSNDAFSTRPGFEPDSLEAAGEL